MEDPAVTAKARKAIGKMCIQRLNKLHCRHDISTHSGRPPDHFSTYVLWVLRIFGTIPVLDAKCLACRLVAVTSSCHTSFLYVGLPVWGLAILADLESLQDGLRFRLIFILLVRTRVYHWRRAFGQIASVVLCAVHCRGERRRWQRYQLNRLHNKQPQYSHNKMKMCTERGDRERC